LIGPILSSRNFYSTLVLSLSLKTPEIFDFHQVAAALMTAPNSGFVVKLTNSGRPRESGDPVLKISAFNIKQRWIPAFAGMTG
jgi:hypothetical protein